MHKNLKVRRLIFKCLARDRVSCRSRSGFLIYVNTALVQWFSKKQSTVETLVFGAEFVAMKQGIDVLRSLR